MVQLSDRRSETVAEITVKGEKCSFNIKPNEEFEFNAKGFKLISKIPFDYNN